MADLINTYEEYIQLLSDEIDETSPIAIAHGWKSSRANKGTELRSKIRFLKHGCNNCEELKKPAHTRPCLECARWYVDRKRVATEGRR